MAPPPEAPRVAPPAGALPAPLEAPALQELLLLLLPARLQDLIAALQLRADPLAPRLGPPRAPGRTPTSTPSATPLKNNNSYNSNTDSAYMMQDISEGS